LLVTITTVFNYVKPTTCLLIIAMHHNMNHCARMVFHSIQVPQKRNKVQLACFVCLTNKMFAH